MNMENSIEWYDYKIGSGDCAVLFVHGIMGSPRQFDFLLPTIPQKVSYYRLVLSGHEATIREFSQTSMAAWLQQVREAIATLRADGYTHVVAVTHSMGGLLALDSLKTVKIDRLLLLNMPLALRPTLKFIAVPLAVSFNIRSKDNAIIAAMTCAGVHPGGNIFHYIRSVARFVELIAIMASTRRKLNDDGCAATAFFSEKDEIVALRSAKILRRCPDTQISTLPTSGHFYYSPTDASTIATALADILREI